MEELRYIQARNLDKFIEDYLLPDTPFRLQVKKAINTICSFLKERCFQYASHPVRVPKVVKGGSSGKGTALKGRSDADLVVFLSNLTSFQDQLEHRKVFIEEIRKQLEACKREEKFDVKFEVRSPLENPRVLSFTLIAPDLDEQVDFDILPAFDALGQVTKGYRPHPQIYVQLISECSQGGEFSTCFTELQRAFLKQRPAKLKSLIRLVKHWYQECKKQLNKSLPPQYALELLTVYAWERGSNKPDFNTAQGFRTVLELVLDYKQLCIYWTKYYDFENPIIGEYLNRQLQKRRPVILDPADPTGNLGEHPERWQRLAEEALVWLSYPCFKNWDGSPVGSWNVPVRPSASSWPSIPPSSRHTAWGLELETILPEEIVSYSYSRRLCSLFYSHLGPSHRVPGILTFLVQSAFLN
ncbi:2'-5'-oligoadenylate synthase 1 isoform X1 [Trichechus manatus latirostris]|uniref:2'-5' oligoadenylate synthase n=1 Tax=Trichechus manatus latirostris TaxID=127582 RepID=A0A2Y9RDE1_TRIMA|nr:2'-5'-oligoadenylate synthase 1 isoform X1 [Trichechus manatus latirostris]